MAHFSASQGPWLQLQDKICVVTGAASGIGASIAHELSQAGARVALLDKDSIGMETLAQTLRSQGVAAISITCDTSDEQQTLSAAAQVQSQLGNAHVLINNAGMLRSASLEGISLADWNAVLAVNLTGYLLCARAFAPQMKQHGSGSIVNVASVAANFPQSHSGAYSASKAAVQLLSRQIAVEWGPHGIRSNAICPGMIRTPLTASFYAQPGVEQARAAATASRRVGEPEDIAHAALFLASPRSSYVNGTEIAVDGGLPNMLMDMVPRPGYNAGSSASQGNGAAA